jgi:enamine deaminase RidA (YjgF/YER057c/UK114 family)
MKKDYLNPKELNKPKFYTHAVSAEGVRKLVHVSGQVSWDAALKAAGAGWEDVVKMNGYMVGMNAERVAAYREARQRFLKEGALPASTLVGVEALVHPDLLLEVEVVAAL